MGLFSGIAKVVKGAVTGFNPVGMLASAAVNALVGKYQTRQQNKAIEAANASALERESTQFERLRDSAVRAGFNPLTALRSGMFQQANLFAKEADTFRGDLFGGLAKAALAMPQARLDAEMRDLERREREANILYTGVLSASALQRMGHDAFSHNRALAQFNEDQNRLIFNADGSPALHPVTGNQLRYPIEYDEVLTLDKMATVAGTQLFPTGNPEAFESGVSEVAGSSTMHAAAAGGTAIFYDFGGGTNNPAWNPRRIMGGFGQWPLATPE
jgi:hypothetical protein